MSPASRPFVLWSVLVCYQFGLTGLSVRSTRWVKILTLKGVALSS